MRDRVRWLALAAVSVAGCAGSHGTGRVRIAVHADSPLADSPVRVEVRGLRAGEEARLDASWLSLGGVVWASSTPLHADAHGTATLRGLDGMRFLWAMRPAHPTGSPEGFDPPLRGTGVRLSVVASDQTVARARLTRHFSTPSVRMRRLTVARDGVYGYLFTPAGRARRPAVLTFGGSEGGDGVVDTAALLAAHGYPALALGYFREPGLPSHLLRIPLEYFAHAARILRRQPAADPARIVTMGGSYGGEGSLLVAASFPQLFHGAIALAPSASVTGGLGAHGGPAGDQVAWTLAGKPVPQGPIPVERITGPVLSEGAGDDGDWASATAVAQIQQRLHAHHFPFAHPGIVYARAGHLADIARPYVPEPTNQPAFGGSPSTDAAARADLWPRILAYLDSLPRHAR
jgi:dienelactone hydrolase